MSKVPQEVTYDDLIKLFNKYFLPKSSTFAARFKFYNAVCKSKETTEDWLARFLHLGDCQFSDNLDSYIGSLCKNW